jgi:hypothetical protein
MYLFIHEGVEIVYDCPFFQIMVRVNNSLYKIEAVRSSLLLKQVS